MESNEKDEVSSLIPKELQKSKHSRLNQEKNFYKTNTFNIVPSRRAQQDQLRKDIRRNKGSIKNRKSKPLFSPMGTSEDESDEKEDG